MNRHIDRYQVSLKIFLRNAEGKILILKAAPDCSYGGYWDFPGGRIDYSEFEVPFKDILSREIIEEVGEIDFSIDGLLPVALGRHKVPVKQGNDVHVLYHFYEATYLGGDIRISDEHTESAWVDLSEIDLQEHFISGLLEGAKSYSQS